MPRLLIVVLGVCAVAGAQACSPMPPQLSKLPDGSLVRKYISTDYYLVARILSEIPAPLADTHGQPTTGLRVQVIASTTKRSKQGDQIDFFAYWKGGSACEGIWGASLGVDRYPVGSKVRISTDELDLPYWEVRYRILLMK
jgi:hypothetical protein